MGLFDTIVIDKLKLDYPPELDSFLKARNVELPTDYQTKDLDCSMSYYKITEDGQLWEEKRVPNGKKVKREPWPKFSTKNQSWLEKLYNNYRDKKFEQQMNATYSEFDEGYDLVFQPSNVTATIYMYHFELVKDKYLTLDYEVILVGGKVVSSRLKEFEIETDEQQKEREIRDKKCHEESEARYQTVKAFQAKWYYPLIRELYNPFIFFLSKGFYALSLLFNKLSYRLRKY